ncbi:MAG: hypothetical protein RL322_1272 [Pseudomonadota bacterium]|jgi:hypothetical protein
MHTDSVSEFEPSSPQDTLPSGGRVTFHYPDDPDRPDVEAFISRSYLRAFEAKLSSFAPVLVALRDAQSTVIAAAGYRNAAESQLFLERYLAAPVEHLLPVSPEDHAARAEIVEVGHLCAARAGAGRSLSEWLALYLEATGFRWLLATLTDELTQLYKRMGMKAIALQDVSADAMGAEVSDWGHYYTHHPRVHAVPLRQAREAIELRRGAH